MMKSNPPNRAILPEDISNNLITLHDLEIRDNADKKRVLQLKNRIAITPAGWSNSFFLKQLPHAIQWHPALAEYDTSGSSLHDVHLVSVPHSHWPVSLNHWLLYSQGSFFHLVLHEGRPRLQIDAFTTEQVEAGLDAIRSQVRCDNMHRLNAHAESRQLPMIAHNIGQTQFNVTQIKGLAAYITSQLQEYTRQEKNCHLFALSLGTRVLMTKGAGTIFVGTKVQIANWDLTATTCEESSPYSQEEGFLLRAPSSDVPHRSGRHYQDLPALWTDLGHMSNAMAIRKLYLHGPRSPGRFDPYGRNTSRVVPGRSISKYMRQHADILEKAVKEFAQDIARGEMVDAFRGRRTSSLHAYEAAVICARKGDRIAQWLLPFHKFIMSISEEDAREVHIRLGNRETGLEDI